VRVTAQLANARPAEQPHPDLLVVEGRGMNRWWTVGAGALANAFGAGPIMVYGYSIMAEGLLADYGWTRADAASFFSAFLLGSGIGIVSLGWLISRLGVRLPSAILAAIFGTAFAAVALLPVSHALFWIVFLIVGIGGAACTAMPYAVTISGTFDKYRGLALGLVVAGSATSAPLFPQVAGWLTRTWGWQANFVVLGTISAIVSVVGLSFFVRTPPGAVVGSGDRSAERRGLSEVYFGNPIFWLIGGAILAASISAFGGMASLVGYLSGKGFDPALVANVISVAAIFSLLGRVLVGYLLDRIHAPWVSAFIFTMAAGGFAILLSSPTPLGGFIGAACIAIAIGSEADILTYLISRYFPLVEFSRVVSVIWLCWAWGGGVGTSIVGASLVGGYGYGPAFVLFGLLLAAGATMLLFLGPYRNPHGHGAPPVAA
jgi:MFS family permease